MIKEAPLADDLPFGARITGVTRESLKDEAVRTQINDIFEDRGLILFEDIESSSQMHLALSRTFGPLRDHAMKAPQRVDQDLAPGIIDISQPAGGADLFEIGGVVLTGWTGWHYDGCYTREIYRAGILRAIDIPPTGGLTGFADGIQLYDAISTALRARLDGMEIAYHAKLYFINQRFGLPKDFRVLRLDQSTLQVFEEFETAPRAIHPAVWRRKSGEGVLHVSPFQAAGVYGHEDREGDEFLEALFDEIGAKMRPYWHRWKATDMIVWDNWRFLHAAGGHDPKYARRLNRTSIEGDYGLGRFEDEVRSDSAGRGAA